MFVWGFGILGKGPSIKEITLPEVLPKPLFGYNELNKKVLVTNIAASLNHFAAITSKIHVDKISLVLNLYLLDNGDLYMWGRNKEGCLGFGNTDDQYFPLRVCLFKHFKLYIVIYYAERFTSLLILKVSVPGLVKKVSLGVDHTAAISIPLS